MLSFIKEKLAEKNKCGYGYFLVPENAEERNNIQNYTDLLKATKVVRSALEELRFEERELELENGNFERDIELRKVNESINTKKINDKLILDAKEDARKTLEAAREEGLKILVQAERNVARAREEYSELKAKSEVLKSDLAVVDDYKKELNYIKSELAESTAENNVLRSQLDDLKSLLEKLVDINAFVTTNVAQGEAETKGKIVDFFLKKSIKNVEVVDLSAKKTKSAA